MYNYFMSAFALFLSLAAQHSLYAEETKSPLEIAQESLAAFKKSYKDDRRNFRRNGGEAAFLTKDNKDTLKVKAPTNPDGTQLWLIGMSSTPGFPDSLYIINRLKRMLRYGSYADSINEAKINVRLAKSQKQGEYLTSKEYFKILKDAGFIDSNKSSIDSNQNWKDHFATDPKTLAPGSAAEEAFNKAANALRLLPRLIAIRFQMNEIISNTSLNLSPSLAQTDGYTYNQLKNMQDKAKNVIFPVDLLSGNLFQEIKQYNPDTPYFSSILKTGIRGASFFDDRQGLKATIGDAQKFLRRSQVENADGKKTNVEIKTLADVKSLGDAIAYLTGGKEELDDSSETDEADNESD